VYVFSQNKGTLFSPFPKKKGLSFLVYCWQKTFWSAPVYEYYGLALATKFEKILLFAIWDWFINKYPPAKAGGNSIRTPKLCKIH